MQMGEGPDILRSLIFATPPRTTSFAALTLFHEQLEDFPYILLCIGRRVEIECGLDAAIAVEEQ
jgi:hypothetical protein